MLSKLINKPENFLLVITTTLSFLFFLWGINSWKFSFVGDEWQFYVFAAKLVLYPHVLNPFSFHGVYGTHSVLASMYQAFFMKLLGTTNFAWRLSNIILIFPLSYFFYQWIKLSFTKQIAILATIFLQCSFYLANFFKIGYDNPQALTFFVICLYFAARFGKTPNKIGGALLGSAVGISFYLYFGAIFPLFILPYFLPLRKLLKKSQVKNSFFTLIAFYLLFILPAVFQLSSLTNIIHSLGSPNTFHLKNTVWYDFFLFYQNHDYFYNHFVSGPYLDSISQIFCLIGTVIALIRLKQSPYLPLILSYFIAVFFIGSTSSDWTSPITRGIFFLPYGFAFAGIGLNTVRESIKSKLLSFVFCWFFLLAAATLNIYQSQVGVFVDRNAGYTGMSLIMQSFANTRNVAVVLSHSLSINNYLIFLPIMKSAYRLSASYEIIRPENLSCTTQQISRTILVFKQDTVALQKLHTLTCNPPLRYTILYPTMVAF
jgi:hypothetical protein